MARVITGELAKRIVKKLKARVDKKAGSAHDMALVYEGDVLIASFGLRRGSEKDKGHDHIPPQIGVGPGFAKLLGQCPKSRDEWLAKIRENGWLSE